MKKVTLSNAIQCAVATLFAIAAIITGIATKTGHNVVFGLMAAIITGIATKTGHNVVFGLMAAIFAWVIFTDDYYGESVKQYILRKRGK